ncbi:MAG: PfkB family carbohydrate kinase [Vicinamibacterales bacterium]|jgi:bifunctional ADP-heptose synthase (sugar kinase/adenylyltransferase)|nr:hypothetical protein [Acidobacteriota bacterium]MDP7477686.1 PfkB family carbohydrate kinase [Vicinamibacterales bacterium]
MYPLPPIKALPGDHDQANRFFELIDAMANRRVAVVGDAGGIVDTIVALGGDVLQTLSACDAVVVSDDGSRSVTPALAQFIRQQVAGRRRRPIPVVINARRALLDYTGCTGCAPTETDVAQLLGVTIGDDVTLERAGRALLQRLEMAAVLVRRSSRGLALFERDQRTVHLPIFGGVEVGEAAGDALLASWTLALAAGASMYEATRLANYAAGLVVLAPGAASVTTERWRGAIEADHDLSEAH